MKKYIIFLRFLLLVISPNMLAQVYYMQQRNFENIPREILNNSPHVGTLYLFNTEQKEQSGGYDAAIVYWSKVLVPINDVIRRLSGKH